jgi:NitT/TauT family transport system substrate-binding protein
MPHMSRLSLLIAVLMMAAATMFAPPSAMAADRLVVTNGHLAGWDALVTSFGVRKGFFQANGLDVQIVEMDTGAPMLQAVVSGSVDVAVGVSMPGFIGAAMKGAPVKMISASFTGVSDFSWYVRADSPIRSFKDVTENTTLAYSSNGSSSQIALLSMMGQAGVSGKPVATGNLAATLTQVMTGQVDVGYEGNGGLGIAEFQHGDVRFIGNGADLESFRDQTVRGVVVTPATLAGRRDQLVRFLKAYRQTIEWMYRDPEALQWFADQAKTSLAEAKHVVDMIYPASALRLGPVHHLDQTIALAVAFKRIPQAPTAAQIDDMFDQTLLPTDNE